MNIKEKCDIVEEFIRDHLLHNDFDSNDINEFIKYNDLGIPLSQAVSYELATLTKNGEFLVEETWVSFCQLFDVDPNGDYEDLDDFFESQ